MNLRTPGAGRTDAELINSICPDSTQDNARQCFLDERCSAVDGTGRTDAEL